MSEQVSVSNDLISKAKGKFHGGIHPEEFKSISNSATISRLPIPAELIIPLKQHIGPGCKLLVGTEEKVIKGQPLAHNERTGMTIHAPVSGTISRIEKRYTGHRSGQPMPAVILEAEPSAENEEQMKLSKIDNWLTETREALFEQVKNSGIVGLGGATFPTAVKLKSQDIETLIVNAMECEPYITCDDRLLREFAEEVVLGSAITAKIVNAQNIIFAIEDNKPEAIEALKTAITEYSDKSANNSSSVKVNFSVVIAPTKYPSGGEKQTIELVTGKQLPKGSLPSSIGLLVQNVATLHAIYRCICLSLPLYERVVTLTGDLVKTPGNYWLPIGIQVNDLISMLDIDKSKLNAVILGGPMMGQSIFDFSAPVTKSTNCIIFNASTSENKAWVLNATSHQACIRCSECQQVCPADLLPQQLLWFSQSQQWEELETQGISDCIECGACAYVCPSEIPLVHYYRYGKSEINHLKKNQDKAEKAKQRFDFREMRLARAKAERALKHQKAAEARKKAAQDKEAPAANKKEAINEALERVKQKKAALANESSADKNKKKEEE